MKIFTNIFLLFFLFAITNCANITGRQLAAPHNIDQINLFEDGNVIAIGNNDNYFIGDISGNWSNSTKLSDLGLEFVDFTRKSKQGIYLIGGFTKNEDGMTAIKGRTVLINSANNVINEWSYEANLNSAMLSNGDLIGSTGNNIFRLLQNGDTSLIHKRKRSTLISVMVANNNEIIICNPYTLRLSNTPFDKYGCYKNDDWEFEGQWFASTIKTKTEPQICGGWIIEVVQKEFDASISGIKIRDLKTGKLRNETKIESSNRLVCIDNKITTTSKTPTTYSLPELKPVKEPNRNRNIKAIIRHNEKAMYLTAEGDIFID